MTDHEAVLGKIGEVEAEMRRIGFWSKEPAPRIDPLQIYGGLPFERWLQFVFAPAARRAGATRDYSAVPRFRIGLCAMRNYDHHSEVPEARRLIALCEELEDLLAAVMTRAS